jgi:hypothetical protein
MLGVCLLSSSAAGRGSDSERELTPVAGDTWDDHDPSANITLSSPVGRLLAAFDVSDEG